MSPALGPVAFAVGGLDPGPARGDHVEEDHPLRPGRQDGDRVLRRKGVVRPGLGVLAAQEDRSLQVELGERDRQRGSPINYGGASVMAYGAGPT